MSPIISLFEREPQTIDSEFGSNEFVKEIVVHAFTTIMNRRCEIDPYYLRVDNVHDVPFIGFQPATPRNQVEFRVLHQLGKLCEIIDRKEATYFYLLLQDRQTGGIAEKYVVKIIYRGDTEDILTPRQQVCMLHACLSNLPCRQRYSNDAVIAYLGIKIPDSLPLIERAATFKRTQHSLRTDHYNMAVIASVATKYHQVRISACNPCEHYILPLSDTVMPMIEDMQFIYKQAWRLLPRCDCCPEPTQEEVEGEETEGKTQCLHGSWEDYGREWYDLRTLRHQGIPI